MKHNRSLAAVFAVIIIGLTFSLAGAQDSSSRFWIQPSAEQAIAGQEVTITVNVSGAEAVYGSSFKLSYDPQAFEAVATDGAVVQPGSFFGNSPSFPLTNKAEGGTIEYAMTLIQPAEPVSGDGALGTVILRALIDAPVVVTPVEASLVSPQFAEVDGRKVAQSMDTVQPEIVASSGSPVTVENTAPVAQEAVVPAADNSVAVASVADALAAQPTMPEASSNVGVPAPGLTLLPVPQLSTMSLNPALIFAALLFLVGIGLLVISVGLYTRMRSVNLLGE